MTSSKFKFLTQEEVPEEYHDRIDWDRQHIGTIIYPSRTKNYARVWVRCGVCGIQQGISVNDVRNWCRGQKKGQFPGTHRQCRYTGTTITQNGYVWIWKPDHPEAYQGKYVPEHILKMEEHLGRYLDRSVESVHHIDGDKLNNDIENLQLRKKFHGKGQAWECIDCGSHNIKAVKLA